MVPHIATFSVTRTCTNGGNRVLLPRVDSVSIVPLPTVDSMSIACFTSNTHGMLDIPKLGNSILFQHVCPYLLIPSCIHHVGSSFTH